ncbi:MAG: hypothetical protein WBV55_13985 [Candidatus Sulfotelmatobacter sp.]
MFVTEGSPNGVGGIADDVPLAQFPRHRAESMSSSSSIGVVQIGEAVPRRFRTGHIKVKQ